MKKFKRSPITIACYVIAALLCVYFVVVAVSTVRQINEYYASYGMAAQAGEIVTYILQQGLTPLAAAILTFMAAAIHDEVRKNNPAYWTEAGEVKAAKTEEPAEAAFSADTAESDEVEFVNDAKADKVVEVAADAEEAVEEAAEKAADAPEEVAEEAADASEEAVEEAADAAAEITGEAADDIDHTIVMDAKDVADALKASYEAADKAE